MAYIPTMPPSRESKKLYGGSPMSEIPVPAVPAVAPKPAMTDTGHHVIPTMPPGVRLVHWEPKLAPVAIDVCSIVVDVPKFIEAELRTLDSRLNNPWTIHGGFTVPQTLDRLRQAGVEVELEPKGGTA